MVFKTELSINEYVNLPSEFDVDLYIKREDRIHDYISGNKYRKLKYNLLEAQNLGFNTLLTFGGAFSNHIAAVAAYGKIKGLKTIGVIRGEELEQKIKDNATLSFAKSCGMELKFVTREQYRNKTKPSFIAKLKEEFNRFYILPEGGTNTLAVKGCEEILTKADQVFNAICCPVGTGGTIAGLINCSQPSQQVLGFPVLKHSLLQQDISKFATKANWKLITDYHFGGYAKVDSLLHDRCGRLRQPSA